METAVKLNFKGKKTTNKLYKKLRKARINYILDFGDAVAVEIVCCKN